MHKLANIKDETRMRQDKGAPFGVGHVQTTIQLYMGAAMKGVHVQVFCFCFFCGAARKISTGTYQVTSSWGNCKRAPPARRTAFGNASVSKVSKAPPCPSPVFLFFFGRGRTGGGGGSDRW